MPDKRYGVIPVQENGFSSAGFTAQELEDLILTSEWCGSLDETVGDGAIIPAVIRDLLKELGYGAVA